MPKLRERIDGGYVIWTGFKLDDEWVYGTWQVHEIGMDYLRDQHIYGDGDDVSPAMFRELLKKRYIWSESGGVRRQWPH